MNWKITQHQKLKLQQDIRVKTLLQEMAEFTYATNADSFEIAFKWLIKEIPARNSFSADQVYRCTHRNWKSVEIWKMTVAGDFKDKMFTLAFVGEE